MVSPQVLTVVLGEQCVEEGVDAAVAVGQAGHQEVDGDDGGAAPLPTLVPVEAEELPQPEGNKASPVGEHDAEDHVQHLLLGTVAGVLGVSNKSPLGPPVGPGQLGVHAADGDARGEDAGVEEDSEVHLVRPHPPRGVAHTLGHPVAVAGAQVDEDHAGQGKEEGHQPCQEGERPPTVPWSTQRGQRAGNGQVALSAHDGQDEDAGVHGEEVEAEEDPAAQVSEVPIPHEVGAHHERDGGQVEEVGQGQVDDVNVHGAAAPHGDSGDHQRVDVPRRAHHAHGAQDAAQEGGGQEVTGTIRRGVEGGAAILWVARLRGACARLHPHCPSCSWDGTSPAATLRSPPWRESQTAEPQLLVVLSQLQHRSSGSAQLQCVALSCTAWKSHPPCTRLPAAEGGPRQEWRWDLSLCPQRGGTRRLLPLPPTGMLAQLLTGRELGKKHWFLHVRNFSPS